ncbi:MAG: hypothetical protein I3270_01995 [Candidatus Moeniiplasma glomeromycotorum]|nr:hypothetical protein [Candidatus Moeniiplasma glomeromycotorum]MCE8162470.1 hypothetical protein [Candidatus Moeniiplasma glomeromycotorum]MCE8166397.1 hypothetical protein [Candidatus Moeniiplasma glomeromycotorum]MCE8166882.1 hypothetical protein [Candidatus Moeniiplasma glomeromycotorum]
MVRKKVVKCSKCGKTSSELIEKEEFKYAEKISKILVKISEKIENN